MNRKLIVAAMFCCFLASTATAQEGKHFSGKMDPAKLAALHAEHARNMKANGIDDSKPPRIPANYLKKVAENTNVLGVLELITDDQTVFEQLELVDEQKAAVNRILENYKELQAELKRKKEGANKNMANYYESQYRQACQELTGDLSEVLVPFQASQLLDSLLDRGGLFRVLTTPTLAAEYVDLSDEQKNRLKEKQGKLGEEVREFIEKKRQEASEIYVKELTREQKKRVVELFGADRLTQIFEGASSDLLMMQSGLAFSPEVYFGPTIEDWREVEEKIKSDKNKDD